MKQREPLWSLTIAKAVNGYVLSYLTQLDDGTIRKELIAVNENDVGDDAECAQRMLWDVLEHFGVYKGIRIELDKGENE